MQTGMKPLALSLAAAILDINVGSDPAAAASK